MRLTKARGAVLSKGLPALLFCAIAWQPAHAGDADPRPEQHAEIEAAIERGNAVREQDEIAPGALQSVALVLRRNGVRCGHIYMSLLGARGEGGGVYRLTMQLKAAVVKEERAVIVKQDASYLLGADFSLLNGEASQNSDWQNREGDGGVILHRAIKIHGAANGTELVFQISEQGPADTAPHDRGEQKIQLKTFKPMPSEVLPLLAGLAAKKNLLHPGDGKPLCVPVISLSELPAVCIQPAWVSFLPAAAAAKPSANAAIVARIRYLKGGMAADGLNVQPPTPEDWNERADYELDARQRVLRLPKPSEEGLVAEVVDAAKLNPQEPYEFGQILKSYEKPAPALETQVKSDEK